MSHIIEIENEISEINQDISLLAVSPNAKYVVTFNNRSIIGYNVKHHGPLKIHCILKELPWTNINKLEVSDDNKIYINFENPIKHKGQLTDCKYKLMLFMKKI